MGQLLRVGCYGVKTDDPRQHRGVTPPPAGTHACQYSKPNMLRPNVLTTMALWLTGYVAADLAGLLLSRAVLLPNRQWECDLR
jgi:hypothetical protein